MSDDDFATKLPNNPRTVHENKNTHIHGAFKTRPCRSYDVLQENKIGDFSRRLFQKPFTITCNGTETLVCEKWSYIFVGYYAYAVGYDYVF